MKRTLIATILLTACTLCATARLGDHRYQCIGRYGKLIDDDRKASLFHFNGFLIVCKYNLDEECEGIVYSNIDQSPLSSNVVARVLEVNSHNMEWQVGKTGMTNTWWRSDGAFAAHDKNSNYMAFASAEMMERDQDDKEPDRDRLYGL